jgi:phage/plasmid-associated DNA primase
MIEGLKRLIDQDGFTESEDIMMGNQEYRAQNDTIAMFVANMCRDDKEEPGTSINTLYKIYCVWSDFEGLRPLSKRSFTDRLGDLGYHKLKGYVNGKSGQTYVSHLVVDTECEDYGENRLEYSVALQV